MGWFSGGGQDSDNPLATEEVQSGKTTASQLTIEDLLLDILSELKIMNLHLMTMTDNHFTRNDVEE